MIFGSGKRRGTRSRTGKGMLVKEYVAHDDEVSMDGCGGFCSGCESSKNDD